MRIVEILAHLKMFEDAGTANFDQGFFEAVQCHRIVPALPPEDGDLITEFIYD